ncbi:C2 domain-containing protein 3 [Sphaerodactylus townsendi]|uniref:C2 domain-containing protein 3 n=1 Tax=Sphaerodactylus townsendi TaxID=933632 RepID=UPI00202696EF|nr:C2 domain-containing protein 3 [Sphaerodactylus townsendi]
MKQKKPKSGPARTKPGRKAKGLCNVSPSTSLPPLVEGQLRCFLKLTVSKILWMVTKPPASVVVRVRWWGETSDGTVFIPRGTSQAEQKTFKTTTCYPVRCGPKQFISYLTDMGVLVLEVMTRTDHLPIGRVQIGGLSQLSPSHPISGFFTIVSPTSEKTGELQVSLALEPLSETYDSNSSVPNTDVSFSSHLPAPGTKEATDSSHYLAPSQLNRPPGGSIVGRESISSSRAPTPRGKDHLYFSENAEPPGEGFAPGQKDPSTVTAYKQTGLFPSGSDHEAQVRRGVENPNPVHVLSLHNPVSKDLLSALLDRGNKLRNAMVASAMKSSPDSDIELYGAHPSIKPEDPRASGKNLKNLNSVLLPAGEDPLQPLPDISGFDLHTENRAIELLLGRSDIPPVSLLDGSPPDSVSLGSEAYGSELNDPHYDQSLLENLFYTARKSDSSLSDFLSDEENPTSCEKHIKIQKSQNVSESGSVGQKGKAVETNVSSPARPLHEPHVEPAGEAAHAVNLSLDRLATLGRIHVARVVVESLKVPLEAGTQNTPGKKSSVGKPPKPASAPKRTFFVEYHFPVKATKNGIGQVAVTTEIIRVASSKISNEVVKFQQRYVFPIQFSGTVITHWWNSDLAFNIYLKKGTQRKPSLIGSAAFPLRDVIQSEQLAVSRELPVEEEDGVAQLGPLKVSLELAADSKDFSSTGTVPAKVGSQAPVFSVRSPAGKLKEVPGAVTPAKSPPLPKQTRCQLHTKTQEALPSASEKLRVGANQQPGPTPVTRNLLAQVSVAEEEALLLHVLLMVPEGKDLAPADAGLHGSCNVYLNCKLFSTEEATRSAVVWGTRHPTFHFSQVTPISLISKHLETLLDRGNKLRNAMVASAMKSSPDADIELYGVHPSIKPEDPRALGKNLKNLNSVLLPAGEDPLQPLPDISGFDLHTENRAIELLLGRSDIPPVSLLDGSPPDSVSLGSEAYGSELNDPHYDQSLLENLFYTARKSDSSLSDFLSDEENPASCEKHIKIQKSRNVSESGSVEQKGKAAETNVSSPARPLHEPHVEPAGEATHAVNLSLDRLATLGRVHVARVVVESLKVPPEAGTQNTPGKKSSMGKPPKPASAQKRTFFVEYHFPVKATKNGIGQVAVTTEIIRVASSKISNEVVKFQQRYVFPIQFSGTVITHWWNSDLAFNIYLKKGTQRKPSLIGSAAFPLRDVIQSEQLAVSRELPVEEEDGMAQLGPLKVSLELAADSKDFSSTGTMAAKAGSQAPVFSVRSPAGKLQEVPGAVTPAKSPPLPQQTRCQLHTKIQEALPSASEKLRVGANQQLGPTPVSRNLLTQMSVAEEEGLLLHVLLMVPEGKDLAPADAGLHGSCNVYLNCKLFSTEEATRSAVVWGTRQPVFHFSQPFGSLARLPPCSPPARSTPLPHLLSRLPTRRLLAPPLARLPSPPPPLLACSPPRSLSRPRSPARPLPRLLARPSLTRSPPARLPDRLLAHPTAPCSLARSFAPHPPARSLTCLPARLPPLAPPPARPRSTRSSDFGERPEGTFVSPFPCSPGLLDVSVKYRCSLKAATGVLTAQAVSISVQICRAAGLQAAARALAEKNPSLQYSADVGVNAYVTVRLPFLPEGERRSTRTVGRTFCPEFDHHAEFPCNLVVQRSSGESCCLGELLQYSEAVFSIFHQNLNSAPGTSQTQASRDYLLGTVKVPTKELLFRRSGIRGWYPVTLPEDLTPPHSTSVVQAVAGGLDLTVTFAHPGDRERVLDAAALLGWNWEGTLGGNPQDNSDSESALPSNPALLTISIPRLWLPVQCLLLAGQAQVNKSTYCYLRYKLYDREAAWTSLRRPRLAEDQKHTTVAFKSKQVELPRSQGLWWYFREERLEFQVWRAYGNERHTERPLDTDRLIGSAYVDLTALGEDSGTKRTVSGVYPLFRRNASNLFGAAVRIHIALASTTPCSLEPAEHGGSSSSEYEEARKGPSAGQQDLESLSHRLDPSAVGASTEKSPEESPPAVDPQESFAVSILVERAMHLSLKGSPLTERGVTAPSSYVSFATADPDSPNATEIVEETDSPVWDFQRQTRLSKELLLDPQQTLVFKVWHKADAERVIGFASVDLSPLLSGFQLVCGWYNIVDFSGQCRGQLKVAVSPLESIIHLKEERLARTRTKAPGSAIQATSPFAFQARDLCAGLPTFSTRDHEELFNPSSKGTEAADHERTGSSVFSTPRHEEHVKNIRRFHESLQQAEGNAHRAGRLDSLSQSSRTSLLRALRKNLSELDEIKRYFSQKLTRPFPDPGTPERKAGGLSSRYSSPASKTADPERQLLLEKSSHLVSQVSNLINGLQNNRAKNGPEPSDACEEFSSRFSALLDQRGGVTRTPEGPRDIPRNEVSRSCLDEKPSSLPEKASCGQGMLYEFLGRAGSQSDPPLDTHSGPKAEEAAESQSEEDYEEDVIEPRTLNELTTVTDKTSPWSSLVSEGEPDPDQEAIDIKEAGWPYGCSEPLLGGEHGRSGSLSVVTQEESLSMPSTARSSTGPSGEERGGECEGKRNLAGSPEDMLWSAQALEADRLNHGDAEKEESGRKRALETQAEGASSEPAALWSGEDSATGYAVAPEIEPEALGFDPQDVDGADTPEEEHRCSPGLSEPAQHRSSSSDEGDQDQPEDSGELLQPKAVLSNPIVVPNFFLPPQHLEASMRLLSLSAPPPTTATESQGPETAQPSLRSEQPILQVSRQQIGSIAALRGVPRRQRNHPKPSLAPADLPEEETQRIARIFSTQFSKQ